MDEQEPGQNRTGEGSTRNPPDHRTMRGLNMRGSGILLPVFSLPSRFGIGDLGQEAYRFIDFLYESGQKYWQILPINPTARNYDDSPYMAVSAFAGNTLLISPDRLVQDGLLDDADLAGCPIFPSGRVDYDRVASYKEALFATSYEKFGDTVRSNPHFTAFCREQAWWLDDYAIFCALGSQYQTLDWSVWPEGVRNRRGKDLAALKKDRSEAIDRERYLQFVFFSQWRALIRYCRDRGIRIIGDMPIYVNLCSADVWTHPQLFQLDDAGGPTAIAGVPPDYFSATGQLWKNPLYRWQEHERSGFSWWIHRFRQNLSLYDLVRIDHFRGLVAYWEVPAGSRDATKGRWVSAPGDLLLAAMKNSFFSFPVIAEDLGIITQDVKDLMKKYHLPGMRVLQFAFTDDTATSPHAPHNLSRDIMLYTGTHDNAPVRGWVQDAPEEVRQRLARYFGRIPVPEELPDIFVHTAMQSVAGTVIIPVQDLLGLGGTARINTPGTETGNWRWRLPEGALTGDVSRYLHDLTQVCGRE